MERDALLRRYHFILGIFITGFVLSRLTACSLALIFGELRGIPLSWRLVRQMSPGTSQSS